MKLGCGIGRESADAQPHFCAASHTSYRLLRPGPGRSGSVARNDICRVSRICSGLGFVGMTTSAELTMGLSEAGQLKTVFCTRLDRPEGTLLWRIVAGAARDSSWSWT